MTRPAVAREDLDRFQAELRERRTRLQHMPADLGSQAPVADEVSALTEQLAVAVEELRVQQEELADSGRRAAALAAERDAWFELSPDVLVLTDRHGSVVRANAAAQRLIALPEIRRPRPLATWFDPQDRPGVRGLIARVVRTRQPAAGSTTVIGPGGTRIPTDVRIGYLPTSLPGGDPGLQWVLQPRTSVVPEVPEPSSAAPQAGVFAELAQELATQPTRESLTTAIVQAATRIIPAADDAGVSIVDRQGQQVLVQSTGPTAQTQAPGSVLSVPLDMPRPFSALLTCSSSRSGAFTPLDEDIAAIFAVHAALALSRSLSDENLRAAVASRQLIGQAVGILIERRKVTAEAAFDQLVRASQAKHVKLREVAVAVVETGLDPSGIRVA